MATIPPAGLVAPLHTGGSAMRQTAPAKAESGDRPPEQPATIVSLSERAQMLVAEANAAQAVADIFAIANGMPRSGEGDAPQSEKTQVLIAHDAQSNEGLYIVWSPPRG